MANDSDATQTGTLGHVRAWLRKSGYPLEMRTAAAFRAHGFATESARHYVTEDGSTLREIDVIATGWRPTGGSQSWLEVVFIAECKAGRAKPWVAFVGDDRMRQDDDVLDLMRLDSFGPEEFDEGSGTYHGRPDQSMVKGLHHAPMLYTHDHWAYAITETGDGSSHAYNAVRQVGSAVDGYARDAVDQTDRPVLRVTIPLVITSAPLVTCRLDDQGSEDLLEVDRVLLVTRLRPAAQMAGVWIIQEKCLDEFATQARAGLDRLQLELPAAR